MASTEDKAVRVAGVVENSFTDGPGVRFALFVQGCPHHCPGCHNPQTHDFAGGSETTVGALLAALDEDPLVSGLTLSGGEPFCQAAACAELAKAAHERGKDVWTWSGWTYEQLREKAEREPEVAELLRQTDVLVDGPFIEAQRDLDLEWRGSANQRVLELKDGVIA